MPKKTNKRKKKTVKFDPKKMKEPPVTVFSDNRKEKVLNSFKKRREIYRRKRESTKKILEESPVGDRPIKRTRVF